MTSVHLELGQCISAYTQGLHQFECRNAVMETHHSTPQPTKVMGELIETCMYTYTCNFCSCPFHSSQHFNRIGKETAMHTKGDSERGLWANKLITYMTVDAWDAYRDIITLL